MLLTAGSAPVLLVGGWTIAAGRQPADYDPVRDTISQLAGDGATDPWIMIGCVFLLACCYLTIAAGLHVAGPVGRLLLAIGGAATVTVIAFPRPEVGGSLAHGVIATVAFLALALWPVGTAAQAIRTRARSAGDGRADGSRLELAVWAVRPAVALAAAAALLALFGWFAIEVSTGDRAGLAERAAVTADSVWPLVVALSAYGAHRRHRLAAAADLAASRAPADLTAATSHPVDLAASGRGTEPAPGGSADSRAPENGAPEAGAGEAGTPEAGGRPGRSTAPPSAGA